MAINAQATPATSSSDVIAGFLITSRSYLGLHPSSHWVFRGILQSEFVDPTRYRITALRYWRAAA